MKASGHPYFAGPPLAFAHRGGARHPGHNGLENTLYAFTGATGLGFQHLETDVHLTADGVVIAFHDEELDRTTDATGRIAKLPWSRVAQARVGGREPIPRLLDLLTAVPQTRINIDLKSPGVAGPTLAVLREVGATGRVCVGSFSSPRLWWFRWSARRDGVATSAGPIGVAALRLLPSWLSRVVHTPGSAYQVPVWHRLFGRDVEVVTPRFVAAAHAIGRQVHVWTVDEADEMHRLLDLGVDGIITDRLDVLVTVFAQRGHPLSPAPTRHDGSTAEAE